MKALVSPNEPVTNFDGSTGYRVAQVENQTFEVGAPLFWIDCNDACIANDWYLRTLQQVNASLNRRQRQ